MIRRSIPSPAQLAEYAAQGFVRLGPWLGEEDLELLREAVGSARSTHPNPYGVLVHDHRLADPQRWVRVGWAGLGAVACALTRRPRAVLFQDNLVWKTPGAARIEWHQDYSYQPLSSPAGVTLWLALDDADERSGCLHYVPGTHRLGERAPADFIRGTGQPQGSGLPPLDTRRCAEEAVAVPVRAGELLAHHPLTWHMSPANTSGAQRRALSVNWLEPEVVWRPGHAPHPYAYTLQPQDGAPLDPGRFPVYDASGAPSTP